MLVSGPGFWVFQVEILPCAVPASLLAAPSVLWGRDGVPAHVLGMDGWAGLGWPRNLFPKQAFPGQHLTLAQRMPHIPGTTVEDAVVVSALDSSWVQGSPRQALLHLRPTSLSPFLPRQSDFGSHCHLVLPGAFVHLFTISQP